MFAKKALAASVSGPPNPTVSDVFSSTLYSGNGGTRTITNNIDLAGDGGLVWVKNRASGYNHCMWDTQRGVRRAIFPNSSLSEQVDSTNGVTSFNSDGFTLTGSIDRWNTSGQDYISWAFRKAQKFFDIVTYTGNGSGRTISHNLGSVPGCIIVKRRDTNAQWPVYHRSRGASATLFFEGNGSSTGGSWWNDTTPTSTVFSLGDNEYVNANGGTYVAYLFAHDAGGFGPSSTDNIISCGIYTGNGSSTGPTITLGYEPQFLIIQGSDSRWSWYLYDNQLDNSNPRTSKLVVNSSDGVETSGKDIDFLSTGFQIKSSANEINFNGVQYIYIAIRKA